MQPSLRVLSLRRPLTVLRPELAQFPRHASLTSAINRGIRKTRGGVDSLERRTSARPARDSGENLPRQRTWRAGSGDREGNGRPDRVFSSPNRSRSTELSENGYGRDEDSPRSYSRSGNVRRYDRAQGTYSNQRQREQDDHTSQRTARSSFSGREDFRRTREIGSQSTSISRAGDGPNRRERRAAIFGTKTWSDSSLRERNGACTAHGHNREQLAQFQTEDMTDNGRHGSASQEPLSSSRSNPYTTELRPKPIRRSRDGHESWQEKQQDPESRRIRRPARTRDNGNEGRRDAFDEARQSSRVGQPRVKVPLSVPYTTAGSEFLYGTHVVKAALQSGRRKLYKLYIYEGENGQGESVGPDHSIYKLALAAGVHVSKVSGDWERLLNKMSDQRPHNGYVLEASPLPKLNVTALEKVHDPATTFDVQVGHQSAEEQAINSTFDVDGSSGTLSSAGGTERYPFLLMLDRIRDPGNLGSIIRSAYFLGAEAIVMMEHGTAPLGPVALKSSASAAEHLPLLMVKNEHAFIRKSQENGWKFFAATSPNSSSVVSAGSQPLALSDMATASHEGPCVLLLGSEEGGIRPQLQRLVNGTVGIESRRGSAQGVDSLNVGVAAALLMQGFLDISARAAAESKGPPELDVVRQASDKVFDF